jgi:tetratricopeptide (TPR) repeat protein
MMIHYVYSGSTGQNKRSNNKAIQMKCSKSAVLFPLLFLFFISCDDKPLPNQEMIDLLRSTAKYEYNAENAFSPEAVLKFTDSLLSASPPSDEVMNIKYRKANALLQLGEEQKAIDLLEEVLKNTSRLDFDRRISVMKALAMAYMRLGERTNCFHNHTAESCIFPISIAGRHTDKTGSEKAIELYKELLTQNPGDLESKWLLNVAYMTIGGHPEQVPPGLLLEVRNDDSLNSIKPFTDVAANIGLNINDQAGGSIIDDFNNDGYLDVVTSSWSLNEPMRYCRSNGDGTFTDVSDSSGLGYLTGGLNITQTDYNNDGFKDIFVFRGGWRGKFGKEPNSLLRNNGDGTFTDVTKESGLLSIHPTQTGTWADFNNDGWLDLFIGNESMPCGETHASELYLNNKNGTFTEVAAEAGCKIVEYVKGVTSGDYDNDGKTDIFISTITGRKILLKNESVNGGALKFRDVTVQAGISNNLTRTFPCWFFDYDNDGWLDLLVCSYEFIESLAYYAAAEVVRPGMGGNAGKIILFRNKHDGTFEDVSVQAGLNKVAFAMGANFGDIDNDGYIDFYLGTGNPPFQSLVPNKLFKNINGQRFLDVTISARVGNLQKGHGVSFADMDNDGHEDIYIDMGGAFAGDSYESSLYINPGQNNNHWINLTLEGTVSNKAAIGARIKVTFTENGKKRSVYRDVNSGGSFGSNPLRQHIGIGSATVIDTIEIKWPVTGKVQVFNNVPADQNIKITEDKNSWTTYQLAKIDFRKIRSGLISCEPAKK